MEQVPVITIDGPAGTGKGTIANCLAEKLGWHILDSGALYRLVALSAERKCIDCEDEEALANLARSLDICFELTKQGSTEILLENSVVTQDIRTEECGCMASKVAAFPKVRAALLERQREFRCGPGLIADGRDMGTVVFPDAPYKVFLTASAKVRAERRYKQLVDQGINASMAGLVQDIEERDYRDMNRSVAPLKPADDAVLIDTSDMSIDEVVAKVASIIV